MRLKAILICLLTMGICKNITACSSSFIPKERISINEKYSQIGLGKRTEKSINEDQILRALDYKNNVYVEQIGTKIILRGNVPDKFTFERVINISRGIEGVTEIDSKELKIDE